MKFPKNLPDRMSVAEDSPHFCMFYMYACVSLDGVEQTAVTEYCASEGWVIRLKKNEAGRTILDPESHTILTEKVGGKVDVWWKR